MRSIFLYRKIYVKIKEKKKYKNKPQEKLGGQVENLHCDIALALNSHLSSFFLLGFFLLVQLPLADFQRGWLLWGGLQVKGRAWGREGSHTRAGQAGWEEVFWFQH